eukprot:CAMPEP_0168790700 /NCGR_PEP_ID=MMETSP0725-20121227/13557_1 /TAXON_ID=265536 /ORGANISM="Amphiprora sp., Strain CCMP467" /LENGTH=46 /DNA_ID= /DNA_START= /DNA_END= /DNA_ORIENTATION=
MGQHMFPVDAYSSGLGDAKAKSNTITKDGRTFFPRVSPSVLKRCVL